MRIATTKTGSLIILREQGQYGEAKRLLEAAVSIRERHLEAEDLLATSLSKLAGFSTYQGSIPKRNSSWSALHIHGQVVKPQHPNTAETTDGLAQLRETQGDSDEAKSLYIHTLAIREQALGTQHPETTETRIRLINLLHALGQHEDAAQLEAAQSEQRTHGEEQNA